MIIDEDEQESTGANTKNGIIISANIGPGSLDRDTTLLEIRSAQGPTSGPSVSVDPSAPNIWYDVEDGCYVDDGGLLLSLEPGEQRGGLTCPPRNDLLPLCLYPRPPAHETDQQESNGITQSLSIEPMAHMDHDAGNDVAAGELEMEVDSFCENRDSLLVASLLCNPRSPRRSIELSPSSNDRHSQSDAISSRSEDRQDASRPTHTPDVGKGKLEQQGAAAVAEEPREKQPGEEDDLTAAAEGRKVQGRQQHEAENEPDALVMGEPLGREEDDRLVIEGRLEGEGVGDADNSEDEGHRRDTDDVADEEDEEDEDPRPAKRRKLPLVSAKEALKPAREQKPKLDVRRPCRLTSPTFMQLEMDDRQSQIEDPKLADDERHNTSSPSQSPTAESVLAAEYEEWPLRGFLKRTRVGSTTSFNLEFHLTYVPEHLELSGLSQPLRTSIRSSAPHQTSQSAAAYSKTRHVKPRHPRKHFLWTKEEDETLVKMKEEDGCSWEAIAAKLPIRTSGAVQVRYSNKFGGARSRECRRPRRLLSTGVVSSAE